MRAAARNRESNVGDRWGITECGRDDETGESDRAARNPEMANVCRMSGVVESLQ